MLFCYYHTLVKRVTLRLNKHEFLLSKGRFVPTFVKIGHVVLKRKISNLVGVVLLFRNYTSLEKKKRTWPYIWTSLYLNYPKILCARFDWNWPCGSGEEGFFNSVSIFSLFVIISPLLAKCVALYLKKKTL